MVCFSYPFCTIYVISEGEEGVRADSHTLQGADPVLLFSVRQKLRHLFIHRLPNCQVWALSQNRQAGYVYLMTTILTDSFKLSNKVKSNVAIAKLLLCLVL